MTLTAHSFPGARTDQPPVVLIHSFASNSAEDFLSTGWQEALSSTGRSVLAIDLPAHGENPTVTDSGEITTTAVVAQILDSISAHIPEGPFDLVGYSLGARLAWEIPAKSVRVRRLVLGGISPFEPFSAIDPTDLQRALNGEAISNPIVGAISSMISAPGRDTDSLVRLIAGLASEPFSPTTSAPHVSTLFAGGSDDPMVEGIENLVTLLPDASLIRVPGDHRGVLEGPEFKAAVLEFLSD